MSLVFSGHLCKHTEKQVEKQQREKPSRDLDKCVTLNAVTEFHIKYAVWQLLLKRTGLQKSNEKGLMERLIVQQEAATPRV